MRSYVIALHDRGPALYEPQHGPRKRILCRWPHRRSHRQSGPSARPARHLPHVVSDIQRIDQGSESDRERVGCAVRRGRQRAAAGRRLRITAQLIDANSDQHLWADSFDGTVEDVFAMQERLARVIVGALRLELTADEERRLADRPIHNVHAHECYLRARHEGWRWRKDAIDRAIRLLRDGLDISSVTTPGYAALGLAHLHTRESGADLGDRPLIEAETCVRKVFALEPASAPGFQLRGLIHYSRGRIQDAVGDLKAALDGDPNNADTLLLLSNCYLISGRVSLARPLIARLQAVDPLTPVSQCLPGFADLLEGNFAAALTPYRRMFEMDRANPMAALFYVWCSCSTTVSRRLMRSCSPFLRRHRRASRRGWRCSCRMQ